jgi:hypothetical protein
LEPNREKIYTGGVLGTETEAAMQDLWEPIKKVTSSGMSPSGVSVSKFLHFTFPGVFPIIDIQTIKRLNGGSGVNRGSYSRFFSAWKKVYQNSKGSFDEIANAVGIPLARVLDIMIFTP